MHHLKVKRTIALVILTTVVGIASASIPTARAVDINRAPELPPSCHALEVDGRFALRVYAIGVQVYRWNGVSWAFVEPVATLYADANYHSKVGTHYAGPTWETNSGSKVVAMRIGDCSPDPTAIPWLLLQATSNEGPGAFNWVTHIQRVNTKGGVAPTAPGSSIGVLAQVPYTTEYYFYGVKN